MLSFNYDIINLKNSLKFSVITIKTRDVHNLSTKQKICDKPVSTLRNCIFSLVQWKVKHAGKLKTDEVRFHLHLKASFNFPISLFL